MEIMIDIETLDTRESAVVLSFAAVPFDIKAKPLYCALDVDEQLALGRTVSAATLAWWAEQSDEARLAALAPPTKVDPRVGKFPDGSRHRVGPTLAFLENLFVNNDVETVWACPPTFDIVILESLYRSMDRQAPIPWSFRQLRDVRTMREEAGLGKHEVPVTEAPLRQVPGFGVPHHPVWDCYQQIAIVKAARNKLGIER